MKPAAEKEKAKPEAAVAWGKAENGLQLGLVRVPGDGSAVRPGPAR